MISIESTFGENKWCSDCGSPSNVQIVIYPQNCCLSSHPIKLCLCNECYKGLKNMITTGESDI